MTVARVQLAIEGAPAKGARFGPWRPSDEANPRYAARAAAYGAACDRYQESGNVLAHNAEWVVETRDDRGELRRWRVRTELQVFIEATEERERRQAPRPPARGTGPTWTRVPGTRTATSAGSPESPGGDRSTVRKSEGNRG